MKVVPNCITLGRILLALILLFLKPLSSVFLAIYFLCGFTDLIDGLIARKTDTTSSLGAKLDSIADMILVSVVLFTIYPFLGLTTGIIIWIFMIGIIRVSSILIALYKYKTYASIHTYSNKFTGIILFITPICIPLIHHNIWYSFLCIVASLSAVEELIIQITSRKLELNRKGLFINIDSFLSR